MKWKGKSHCIHNFQKGKHLIMESVLIITQRSVWSNWRLCLPTQTRGFFDHFNNILEQYYAIFSCTVEDNFREVKWSVKIWQIDKENKYTKYLWNRKHIALKYPDKCLLVKYQRESNKVIFNSEKRCSVLIHRYKYIYYRIRI